MRPVRFFSPDVALTRRDDGAYLMRSLEPLADYDNRIGDWLDRWAEKAPDRTFLVEQTNSGERIISYSEAHEEALALAEGLLSYELSPDRPLAILATNSIDHALVMLAALYIGIPIAPIAPAYALQSTDYKKLSHSFRLLTPGLLVVEDGALYRTQWNNRSSQISPPSRCGMRHRKCAPFERCVVKAAGGTPCEQPPSGLAGKRLPSTSSPLAQPECPRR